MGVIVEVLKAGKSSRKPKAKEVVHCHYTGTLKDGTVFDSSVSRGKPLTFMIGIGAVIKAWDEVREQFACVAVLGRPESGRRLLLPGT